MTRLLLHIFVYSLPRKILNLRDINHNYCCLIHYIFVKYILNYNQDKLNININSVLHLLMTI